MKDMKKFLTGSLLAAGPLLAFAQGADIWSIVGLVKGLLNVVIPILFTVALVYFLWGVIRFVITDNADSKEKAKEVVIRGVIGLFVMVSIWGLVGFVQNTLGIGSGGVLTDEQIPGVGAL